jgi:tetratricopeptide (TPR) repeat protein
VRARLRRTSCTVFAFACSSLLFSPTHAALAADAPSAEGQAEARRIAAKEKFEQGVAAYKQQRFADAVKLFLEADSLAPSAPLSFNVARSFEKLDDASGALRWYRDYLRRSPDAANAVEVRAKVSALAATLSQHGVQQVTVMSEPAGATVLVDEQNVGITPVTRDLRPGRHRLVVRLTGYEDQVTDLVLEPQTPQDVALRLDLATQPSAATGATPGPLPGDAAPARDSGPRFGAWPVVVMGAGAASLLGAVGFEFGRRSADSAAEDAPQTEFQEHYDTMESRQTTARVLAGVGGALLVTGGVLFVLDWQRQSHANVALGCAGGSCGLLAKGSFR